MSANVTAYWDASLSSDQRDLARAVRKLANRHRTEGHRPPVEERPRRDQEWVALTQLELVRAGVPTACGGLGGTLSDLNVIVGEFGAALAAPSYLPTMLCALVLAEATGEGAASSRLAQLLNGGARGAVAFDLWDGARPIALDGDFAEFVVVVRRRPEKAEVGIVEMPDPGTIPARGLDITRGTVLMPTPTAMREIDPASLDRALSCGLSIVAAEAAGGLRWCLQVAAEYALVREQFGRPIAAFQAIKHLCADLYLSAVATQASARLAAASVDERDALALATAASSKVYATDGYLRGAEAAIHVLGGMGFTWEHDAHVHYRRAKTLQHLVAGNHSLSQWAAGALGVPRSSVPSIA